MTRPLTQCQRVARALTNAGAAGVTQLDFDAPTDGGRPIRRLASRVADLRSDGYRIDTRRDRTGLARYVLSNAVRGPRGRAS